MHLPPHGSDSISGTAVVAFLVAAEHGRRGVTSAGNGANHQR